MLAKFFLTVSGFTLLSRLFGFARDILLAYLLGAGPLAQAFLVALKLPSFFRRLFAEGAFNAAFVPIFSSSLERDGAVKSKELASHIFSLLVVALMVFTVVFELFMPYLLYVVAPGFVGGSEIFSLTVELTRVTFPYLMFISVATIFASILNSHSRFGAVAFMPVLFNISLISFLLFSAEKGYFDTHAHALSWGVFVAGILQIIWMIYNLRKINFVLSFRFSYLKITDEIRYFLRKFAPGVVGAGITQINLWVDVVIATFFSGAVAFLYYADRVNQLPLSIIGTAMGTALLPTLSRKISAQNFEESNKYFSQAVDLVLLLTIPATFALSVISVEIVEILFGRGEFDEYAVSSSSKALVLYSFGLPAFALVKVFSSAFFALKDTKSPVVIASYSLVLNILLNISFVFYFQYVGLQPHLGLALATSISGWFNALYLYFRLKGQGKFSISGGFLGKLLKILISSCIMSLCLLGYYELVSNGWWQILVVVIIGVFIYFSCVFMLKLISKNDVRTLFGKK